MRRRSPAPLARINAQGLDSGRPSKRVLDHKAGEPSVGSHEQGFAGTARAADPGVTIGEDGKTAPVFDYTQAVRERVFIPQPGVDQDGNDRMDFVTADIIRPRESGPEVKVPAIIDPSPY